MGGGTSSPQVLLVPHTHLNVSKATNLREALNSQKEQPSHHDLLMSLPSSHQLSVLIKGRASGFLISWSQPSFSLEQQHHDLLFPVASSLCSVIFDKLRNLEMIWSLSPFCPSSSLPFSFSLSFFFPTPHTALSCSLQRLLSSILSCQKYCIWLSKIKNLFVVQLASAIFLYKASAFYGCKDCRTERGVGCDNTSGKSVRVWENPSPYYCC